MSLCLLSVLAHTCFSHVKHVQQHLNFQDGLPQFRHSGEHSVWLTTFNPAVNAFLGLTSGTPTQPVPYTTDIAKMLLISRAAVLECWPAEEYALKNGKTL